MSTVMTGNPLFDALGEACQVTLIAQEGDKEEITITLCGIKVAVLERDGEDVWVKD